MELVDALVVGAGPAGSTVAERLARGGCSVRVLEEHARVGYPVQCAGLVSDRALELAGSRAMVRAPVHGATVYSPSFRSLAFKASAPRAYVIDRAALDVHLADRAARSGAVYETGVRFDALVGRTDGASEVRATETSTGTERRFRARLVIGADGVTSAVARAVRLRRPVEILPAYEVEYAEAPGDPDQVEVFLGRSVSPGLFGWWIPDGAGGARVGVAVTPGTTSARVYLDRLVARIGAERGRVLRGPLGVIASGIPVGTVPRFVADGAMLVGDAAAQVKPLSGGGIFTGMRAAELAAGVALEALAAGDLSAARLARYETLWRETLGEEFRKALYLRKVFVRLSDAEFERLLEALQDSGMKESIVAFGDIDFPTHVAGQLLRQSPSLVRLFPKALGAWLSGPGSVAPSLEPPRGRQAT